MDTETATGQGVEKRLQGACVLDRTPILKPITPWFRDHWGRVN